MALVDPFAAIRAATRPAWVEASDTCAGMSPVNSRRSTGTARSPLAVPT
jgi:hypothetical protein